MKIAYIINGDYPDTFEEFIKDSIFEDNDNLYDFDHDKGIEVITVIDFNSWLYHLNKYGIQELYLPDIINDIESKINELNKIYYKYSDRIRTMYSAINIIRKYDFIGNNSFIDKYEEFSNGMEFIPLYKAKEFLNTIKDKPQYSNNIFDKIIDELIDQFGNLCMNSESIIEVIDIINKYKGE